MERRRQALLRPTADKPPRKPDRRDDLRVDWPAALVPVQRAGGHGCDGADDDFQQRKNAG